MTDTHTIHLYRQYMETISNNFFPEILLYNASTLRQAKTFGETSTEFFVELIIATHVRELDVLFKKRLYTTKGPTVKLKLNSAQVVCLYQLLLNHPIHADKVYFLLVRQTAIDVLHQAIMTIALQAEVAGINKKVSNYEE